MKKLLIKLFFRENFVGQLSAALAATIAAYLISVLPAAPEIVTTIVGVVVNVANLALDLPPVDTLNQSSLVLILTPILAWGINAIVQQYIAKDNNAALQLLKDAGKYPGPLDSWVGDVAQSGLGEILTEAADSSHRSR